MNRLTPEQLAEIRTRLEAAEPGPWRLDRDQWNSIDRVVGANCWVVSASPIGYENSSLSIDESDAAFIVAAPTDVAALLAHAEVVETELEEKKLELEYLGHEVVQLRAELAKTKTELERTTKNRDEWFKLWRAASEAL